MSKYYLEQGVLKSRQREGAIDLVAMTRNRLRRHAIDAVLTDERVFNALTPVAVQCREFIREEQYDPLITVGFELEVTPITREAARHPIILDYPPPDLRRRYPAPSPKPKPFSQRLSSWWKEMQKPLPYDGPRG